MANILIVEDDRNTNEAICSYMQSGVHDTYSIYDGAKALELFHEYIIDCV